MTTTPMATFSSAGSRRELIADVVPHDLFGVLKPARSEPAVGAHIPMNHGGDATTSPVVVNDLRHGASDRPTRQLAWRELPGYFLFKLPEHDGRCEFSIENLTKLTFGDQLETGDLTHDN